MDEDASENINSTQSADANVNAEVSSAASADANTNANIKFLRIIRECDADAVTRSIFSTYIIRHQGEEE